MTEDLLTNKKIKLRGWVGIIITISSSLFLLTVVYFIAYTFWTGDLLVLLSTVPLSFMLTVIMVGVIIMFGKEIEWRKVISISFGSSLLTLLIVDIINPDLFLIFILPIAWIITLIIAVIISKKFLRKGGAFINIFLIILLNLIFNYLYWLFGLY